MDILHDIYNFKRVFDHVIGQGLRCFWDGNGDVYGQEKYKQMLEIMRNDDSKFAKLDGRLKGGYYDMHKFKGNGI